MSGHARLTRVLVCLTLITLAAVIFFYTGIVCKLLGLARLRGAAGIRVELVIGFVLCWGVLAFWLPWPAHPANKWVRAVAIFCVSAIAGVLVMWLGFIGTWMFASHFPYFGTYLRRLFGKSP